MLGSQVIIGLIKHNAFWGHMLGRFLDSAVKRAWVGVVLGCLTPWEVLTRLIEKSREPVGQSGQYFPEVGGVLQNITTFANGPS